MPARTVGSCIREARKRLGLQQSQFAAGVGVSQTTVSHWENDRILPDPGQLRRIEKTLRLPAGSLAHDAIDEISEAEQALLADPDLDETQKRIIIPLYRHLTGREQWPDTLPPRR